MGGNATHRVGVSDYYDAGGAQYLVCNSWMYSMAFFGALVVNHELETIRQQCKSFDHGLVTLGKLTLVSVMVSKNERWYRFSDPDLNVIIAQLATLYKGARNEL